MDCLTRYHDFHSSSLLRACQNVMLFVSFSHLCFLSLLLYLICVFKDLFITLFRIFNFASHEVNNSLSVHFNVVHQWEVLHFQRMSLGLLGRQAPINPPFGRCWKGTPSHGRLDCYIRLVYCSILFFFFLCQSRDAMFVLPHRSLKYHLVQIYLNNIFSQLYF